MSSVLQVYQPSIHLLSEPAHIPARVITQSTESTGVPVRHHRPLSESGNWHIPRPNGSLHVAIARASYPTRRSEVHYRFTSALARARLSPGGDTPTNNNSILTWPFHHDASRLNLAIKRNTTRLHFRICKSANNCSRKDILNESRLASL